MWGDGFYLSNDEAQTMLSASPANASVVRLAVGGQDLNSAVRLVPHRYVIDFGEMGLAEASALAEPFAHLQQTVKPWRTELDPKRYSRIVREWWKHFHPRQELYREIETRGLKRVLVRSRVSEHHMVEWLPSDVVYLDALTVWCFDGWEWFGLVQSGVHEAWARRYASTLEGRMRYGAATCWRTFPVPTALASIVAVAVEFEAARFAAAQEHQLGLTALYSAIHDPKQTAHLIAELRASILQLDEAVARAYGWSDISVAREFRRTDNGVRYVMSDRATNDLVARLLSLNIEQSAGSQLPSARAAPRSGKNSGAGISTQGAFDV